MVKIHAVFIPFERDIVEQISYAVKHLLLLKYIFKAEICG
jgi:hypothetical protein